MPYINPLYYINPIRDINKLPKNAIYYIKMANGTLFALIFNSYIISEYPSEADILIFIVDL